MKHLLILGAGTAGTILSHKMRRILDDSEWQITLIDRSRRQFYQPSFVFIPFKAYGYLGEAGNARAIWEFKPEGVDLITAEVTAIDADNHQVEAGEKIYPYDWLVLALGCRIAPERIPGMAEGYGKNVFYFYTMSAALDLQKALGAFDGGKLVLNVAASPIKWPAAPIEFVCLAHYYFEERGIRDKVELEVVTSMDSVFPSPMCAGVASDLFSSRGIRIVPNFRLAGVDADKGVIISDQGDEVRFDLLTAIPPNVGPEVIDDAGLGDGQGYALTDPTTFKSERDDHIYAVGDCTNVAASKAGSLAHLEAGVVAENLAREIRGEAPDAEFDGHCLCFVDTGFKKAYLIDFNHAQEPVSGKLPLPFVGPFALLKETRANHLGKLLFRRQYWQQILPDRRDRGTGLLAPPRIHYLGDDKPYVTGRAA